MRVIAVGIFFALIVGCASKKINYDNIEPIENKEFEREVKIKVQEVAPNPAVPQMSAAAEPPKPLPKESKTPEVKKAQKILPKKPDLEDSEGFSGRRPIVDPFVVGERVTMDVKYMNARAGTLTFETLPYAVVNGRKTYHFRATIKSTPTFDYFYSVDDLAETFVAFDELIPLTHVVRIRESKQYGEIRSFFDWTRNIGKRWEAKYVEGKGRIDKKKEWAIESYAQNVISSIFYLRTFTLKPDKTIAYRVADGGDNYVFKGKVLRREVLSTPLGQLKTVVVQPEIMLKGAFKPMGDIFLWLTDDDRKHIVQMQVKIKIGSLFAKVTSIQ